jgi:hypothetical protein
MTTRKHFKDRVRERMDRTGESYTAAASHMREPSTNSEPPDHRTGAPDDASEWAVTKGLVHRLASLVADLDRGSIFVPAPEPADTWEPAAGTLRLSREWRMSLVSTVTLLADRLGLSAETSGINQEYTLFRWASQDRAETVEGNPYVKLARSLLPVARSLLVELDAASP